MTILAFIYTNCEIYEYTEYSHDNLNFLFLESAEGNSCTTLTYIHMATLLPTLMAEVILFLNKLGQTPH